MLTGLWASDTFVLIFSFSVLWAVWTLTREWVADRRRHDARADQ